MNEKLKYIEEREYEIFKEVPEECQKNFDFGCGPKSYCQCAFGPLTHVCKQHDYDYLRGGKERDRYLADSKFFFEGLRRAKIYSSPWKSVFYVLTIATWYMVTRLFGWVFFSYRKEPENYLPLLVSEHKIPFVQKVKRNLKFFKSEFLTYVRGFRQG